MKNDHKNLKDLTAALESQADLALKFYFDGFEINQGYHITEVKHAAINSIDCGKSSKTEQWDEITIQLLDGSTNSKQGYMSGSKFLAIIGSAMKSLSADDAPYLFFEFAPENGPIRKLSVDTIEFTSNEISVSLGSEQAVCKPYQRAKAAAILSGDDAMQSSKNGCCTQDTKSEVSGCC